jgi:glycosyltransferase involved in cell wall biosynthesis
VFCFWPAISCGVAALSRAASIHNFGGTEAAMKTSIAMTTYNGSEYLWEQLLSFAAQTRVPDELVVCDDRSSDTTVEILNRFARSAAFKVRILVNDVNVGYVRNFERALSLCEGELVFLSDQDDVWFDTKIDEIVRYMEENPRCLVVTNDQIITDARLVPADSVMANIRKGGFKRWYMVAGCCTAIRRAWLKVALPVHPAHAFHDSWICRLADFMNVRSFYDRPLQYYRRHGSCVSNATFMRKVTKFKSLSERLGYGLADARPGWRKECDKLLDFQNRLSERADYIDALGYKKSWLEALEKIALERGVLEKRISLLSQARWERIGAVLSFWRAGGYGHFEGWKSAIKDVLR